MAKELLEMFNFSKVVQALNSVGSIEILLVEMFRSGEKISQYKSIRNYFKELNKIIVKETVKNANALALG